MICHCQNLKSWSGPTSILWALKRLQLLRKLWCFVVQLDWFAQLLVHFKLVYIGMVLLVLLQNGAKEATVATCKLHSTVSFQVQATLPFRIHSWSPLLLLTLLTSCTRLLASTYPCVIEGKPLVFLVLEHFICNRMKVFFCLNLLLLRTI